MREQTNPPGWDVPVALNIPHLTTTTDRKTTTMRQTVTLTLTIDIDHDAAQALPPLPGHMGPDAEPPITGLDAMMTDLRADILEHIAQHIKEGGDLVRLSPITLGCRISYGEPYTPTYDQF